MKDFKNMPDSTMLRVKVPKKLYEAVKKELENKKKLSENLEEAPLGPPPGVAAKGDQAPNALSTLIANQAFGMGVRGISDKASFEEFMNAVFSKMNPTYKSKAIADLKAYATSKTVAPTPGQKTMGPPPVNKNASFPPVKEDESIEEGEGQIQENLEQDLMNALPALGGILASGVGIAYLKDVLANMKAKGLKGAEGFEQSRKEVGKSASTSFSNITGAGK